MKYKIEKRDGDILVRFEDVGGNAQAVMEAIGRCRFHSWECTAGECHKIGSMAPCDENGVLALRLKPRADEELDAASLGECLKYQLPRFVEGKK